MTGQNLLTLMNVLDRELKVGTSEPDVTRALAALNAAQDYFESLLTLHPNTYGSAKGTVVTATNTETTAFPTGVIRVDRLQFIDPATGRPTGPDLDFLGYVGAHVNYDPAVPTFLSTPGTSRPVAYWTNGAEIFWDPLPDAIHTFRYYGLATAADITASGTFTYPDYVGLPLANFAAKLLQVGVDDPADAYNELGETLFTPVILAMKGFNHDRPAGYDYRFSHTE